MAAVAECRRAKADLSSTAEAEGAKGVVASNRLDLILIVPMPSCCASLAIHKCFEWSIRVPLGRQAHLRDPVPHCSAPPEPHKPFEPVSAHPPRSWRSSAR